MLVLEPSLAQIYSFQVAVSYNCKECYILPSLQYSCRTCAWIPCQRKYLSNLSWQMRIYIPSISPHKGKVSTYPLGNKGT